jgi:hypothetical protein
MRAAGREKAARRRLFAGREGQAYFNSSTSSDTMRCAFSPLSG